MRCGLRRMDFLGVHTMQSQQVGSDESEFLYHAPCNRCGSSDGNSVYSDGHTYCFVCNHYESGLRRTMNYKHSNYECPLRSFLLAAALFYFSKKLPALKSETAFEPANKAKNLLIVFNIPSPLLIYYLR